MYQQDNINIPVLGIVENMAYYKTENDNVKHYIFGKDGAKNLAEDFKIPFLGEIPIIQQIRDRTYDHINLYYANWQYVLFL